MVQRFKDFLHKNPARVAAWVSSTVAIVLAVVLPDLPVEPVTIFVLSTLGLGEFAQRVENNKTIEALYTSIPTSTEPDSEITA